ncbi:hypothetical protein E6H35_07285, partial [Candidatus Bathyarchaeota archaeon]
MSLLRHCSRQKGSHGRASAKSPRNTGVFTRSTCTGKCWSFQAKSCYAGRSPNNYHRQLSVFLRDETFDYRSPQKLSSSVSMTGKSRMVEFEAEGRQGRGFLVTPEKQRGAVLVLHAWWGLNDFFKSFSNRLSSQGFVVLAPDLHDGGLAKTVAEAKELKSKIADERIKKIVLGAAEYLRSIPPVSGRKIGVVGFSMGAAWSLLL